MSGLSDVQRGALKSCLEEIYFGYGEKDWERLAGVATDRIASAVSNIPCPPGHGTVLSYRKGCRCEYCREAKRLDRIDYLTRKNSGVEMLVGRPSIPLAERKCGLYTTYAKGCRCIPCTEANAEYGREYRANREIKDWGFS